MENQAPAQEVAPTAFQSRPKGEAAIKKEFVRPVVRPQRHIREDVRSAQATGDNGVSSNGAAEATPHLGEKRSLAETGVPVDDSAPRAKRQRGMNKSRRPTIQRLPMSERLCSLMARGSECAYGDKCRFSHDVAAFLASREKDLEGECLLFNTMGKCPYGLMCRFAGNHLGPNGENLVNEAVASLHRPTTVNVLSKDLQGDLRRRLYNFTRANDIVAAIESNMAPAPAAAGDDTKHQGEASASPSELASAPAEPTSTPAEPVTAPAERVTAPVEPVTAPAEPVTTPSVPVTTPSVPANDSISVVKTLGAVTDLGTIKLRPQEKKLIDFSNKLSLAPLTTVGNLPYRRICKRFGADITCGEMALATQLLQGQSSEWALVKRHESEDIFGVQIAGSFPDSMTRCVQVLQETCELDFIDINVGCPIDLIYKKGAGCALMSRPRRFETIVRSVATAMDIPLSVKMRTGVFDKSWNAHQLVPKLYDWGASLVTVHGRSREQRYTRQADWAYLSQCAAAADGRPFFGNGDIMSYEDFEKHREITGLSGVMIARGGLIKPWLFTEIKERRHWDISSSERLDILRDFSNYGLEHWGSDSKGVETTRRFLLEWLSFLHRYIPVGILEVLPQAINERPVPYFGRDELETQMASDNCQDWVKITEMLLGPVGDSFSFIPKHRANSYPVVSTS